MAEHPWIQSYPAGTSWSAPLRTMPLAHLLDDTVRRWPDRSALRVGNRKISYRELAVFADRMAHGLQRLGVKGGTHVGLFLPNTAHYMVAFFAVLKAGGTVVTYSPLDAGTVLQHKVEDSQTKFIVTLDLPELYSTMNAIFGKTGLKALIVGTEADFNPVAGLTSVTV
jgi:long-chain acyl-CoA synthetase